MDEDDERLAALSRTLSCPMCQEILKIPMSFTDKCQHTYCSFCIRSWLLKSPTCPSCKEKREQSDLRSNKPLQDACAAFVQVFKTSKPGSMSSSSSSVSKEITVIDADDDGAILVPDDGSDAVPSAKRARLDVSVAPPVLLVGRRLPFVAYDQWSDKVLNADLSTLKLPITGTRDERVALHRTYTLLHNARVDGGLAPDPDGVRKEALEMRTTRLTATMFREAAAPGKPPAAACRPLARARRAVRERDRSLWTWKRVPSEWRAFEDHTSGLVMYWNSKTRELTTEPPPALEEAAEEGVILVVPKERGGAGTSDAL